MCSRMGEKPNIPKKIFNINSEEEVELVNSMQLGSEMNSNNGYLSARLFHPMVRRPSYSSIMSIMDTKK